MIVKRVASIFFLFLLTGVVIAQDSTLMQLHDVNLIPDSLVKVRIDGHFVTALIQDGDTIIIADIENINISSPRRFSSSADYRRYMKYKHYAATVYPYAKEAIRIFREAEYVTANMKRRKRKRYIKKLSKELEEKFEAPLKNLTKTQGKIMVKMIEKELDRSMHELILMTQGKMKAFYWNQSSKLYGYRLKKGYTSGENPILDIVLQDFDLSYHITKI